MCQIPVQYFHPDKQHNSSHGEVGNTLLQRYGKQDGHNQCAQQQSPMQPCDARFYRNQLCSAICHIAIPRHLQLVLALSRVHLAQAMKIGPHSLHHADICIEALSGKRQLGVHSREVAKDASIYIYLRMYNNFAERSSIPFAFFSAGAALQIQLVSLASQLQAQHLLSCRLVALHAHDFSAKCSSPMPGAWSDH